MGVCKFESMDAFMKELSLHEGDFIHANGYVYSIDVKKTLEPNKRTSDNMCFRIVKDSDRFFLEESVSNGGKKFSADEDMFFYDSQEKFLAISACKKVPGSKWEMQYYALCDVKKQSNITR